MREQGPIWAARWGRGLLGAHLAASPLVFSTGNVDPFEFVKAVLLVVAASAAGTMAAMARLGSSPTGIRSRPADRLLLGGGMLLAISAGASALFAISPLVALRGAEGSFAGLVTFAALAVVFAATRQTVVTDEDERNLLRAIPWAVAGVCIYALLQVAGLDPIGWVGAASLGGAVRPFSTLGHPNHLAAWLAVASPLVLLSVFEAVRESRPGRTVVLTLLLAVSCATVLLSLSRGGWAALAGGLAVTVAAAPSRGRGVGFRKVLLVGAFCVVGAVVPLVAFRSPVLSPLAERIGRAADLGARGEMWRGAVTIFSSHPLLGCGPDNLSLAWSEGRSRQYRRIERDRTPARAHDDALHLLATQGVVGLLASSVTILGVGRRLRRSLGGSAGGRSARTAAISGVLTAFVIQGLAGFTVVSVAVLAVTVVALGFRESGPATGVAEAPPLERSAIRRKGRRFSLATAGLVLVILLGGFTSFLAARVFIADRLWRAAQLAGNRSGTAVESLRRAQPLDPTRDVLALALGESARRAALTASTLPERTRLRSLAEEAFVRATFLVPASGYNWLGLARLQKDRFRDGEASEEDVDQAFDAALARDPRNASFLADAANAALEAGRLERGEEIATRCASFYPEYGPPAGQLGLVDLIRGRPQEAYRRLERSLMLDWREQAAARAVTLYNAAAAAVAVGDSASAVRWARASLEIEPSSPEARYNLARALEGVGRTDEARREYQTVVDLAPYHPVAERARQKLALSQ